MPQPVRSNVRGLMFSQLGGMAPTILFLFGVFLTFAPVMLMTVRTAVTPGPWGLAMYFIVSGLCGTLWAMGGVFDRRIFIIAVIAQLAAVVFLPAGLGGNAVRAVGGSPVGVASVLSIAAGYTCFAVVISRYARQSMTLSVEMDLAGRIHRHLVPAVDLSAEGFEVAARSDASGYMGGDVVHATVRDDGSVEAIVADVAGHGVRAGVVMAMVRSAIESHSAHREQGDGRSLVLGLATELNRVLVALTEPDMFVTAALVHVMPDGRFVGLLAAHPPFLCRRAASRGGAVETLGGDGLPLGVLPELDTTIVTGAIEPGDSLILYSDGITEAAVLRRGRDDRTKVKPMLGLEGVAAIAATLSGSAQESVDRMLDEVDRRCPGIAEDDRSVLVIRRR